MRARLALTTVRALSLIGAAALAFLRSMMTRVRSACRTEINTLISFHHIHNKIQGPHTNMYTLASSERSGTCCLRTFFPYVPPENKLVCGIVHWLLKRAFPL